MLPTYYARKREQDEARREEQADEYIRELEQKLYNIWKIYDQGHHSAEHRLKKIRRQIPSHLCEYNALDGGGGGNG